jgi:CheY-like chemotaxis protein
VHCCTNSFRNRHISALSRRFASAFGYAILLAGIWWPAATFAAAWPEDETSEQRYWKKVQEQQAQRRNAEEQKQNEQRAAVSAELSELHDAAAAIQPLVLRAQDGPAPVYRPPPLEAKGDYVVLSTVSGLIILLTGIMLLRHKREAEIRALSGPYLSDGVEVARFEMSQLFQMPVLDDDQDGVPDPLMDSAAIEPPPVVESSAPEFFAQAPERMAEIRTVLVELTRATDEAARHGVLLRLHQLIYGLSSKADCWDLRPVWQLSSALNLLLKRLADKGKEATPSTLRTVAHAVDLLGEICVPGIRPDLIIHPPISVLAVDDNPLCLRAVVFALHKAEMTPEIAADGEKAVALAGEKSYDVIFMDIQMPGIDGLTAAAQIRGIERNATTPVVFVTIQSDFHTRAKASVMGGTDLIAKPFLVFELTVKALTLAMRKRLQLAASCEREVSGLARPVPSAPASAATPKPVLTSPELPATEEEKIAA